MALLLMLMRLAGVLFVAPVLGVALLPPMLRAWLLIVLAAALVATPAAMPAQPPMGTMALVTAMAMELLLGAALGFGIHAVFAAFMFGGNVLDFQMGFAMANVFDPASQSYAPLMGRMLQMVGLVAFLGVGGHHLLIEGMLYTLDAVPLGAGVLPLYPAALVAQFGLLFSYGVMIVAPAVVGLLFLDVAIAVAARTMPQVNVYFVSLPAKVFVGLLLTAMSMRYLGPLFARMTESVFAYWMLL